MNNIEKIQSIKDEVKEFHPLLLELFKAHPAIIDVKYTHGPREFGADFVLTKRDEITMNEQYVGVIVKTTVIKQDSSDVLRQIDECAVPRYIESAKKRIYLNEIHIITSQNITSNAEDIIHEKFKDKNIVFIDACKLETIIQKYLPAYFSEFDTILSPYLQSLQKEMESKDVEMNLITKNSQSFYIEQTLHIKESKYKQKPSLKKRDEYKLIELIKRYDSIFIEGIIGSGKSKLVRNLCKHFCQYDNFKSCKIIPIYYTADAFYKESYHSDIKQYGEKFREKYKLSNGTTILLVIDGIDELKITSSEKLEFIEALSKFVDSTNKLIVTSRNISEIDDSNVLEKYYTLCGLNLLSMRQVYNFIEKICMSLDVSNRLYEDLKKSTLFSMIPKTPIAAILLGQLLNENIELPSTLTELYQKYTELALGRWDVSKGFKSTKEYEIATKVITELANYMMLNSINEIAYSELKERINHYLESRNLLQVVSSGSVLDFIEKRCDILFFNSNKSTAAFKHRSFLEFFYAKAMAENNNIAISDDIFNPYWSSSYFFLIGLKKDCDELLQSIIDTCPVEDKLRFLKIINLGNYLMAGYLTPYVTVSSGIKKVFIETSYFINDLLEGKMNNALVNFSEMQILSLFREIIYSSYSFNFFHKAIEEAILEMISDTQIPNQIKGVMLFYLNISLIDLKKEDLFDELITQYYDSLPMSIRLAIYHESSESKIKKSRTLIKALKKLKSSFRNDQVRTDTSIANLYDKPLLLRRRKKDPSLKGHITIQNS